MIRRLPPHQAPNHHLRRRRLQRLDGIALKAVRGIVQLLVDFADDALKRGGRHRGTLGTLVALPPLYLAKLQIAMRPAALVSVSSSIKRVSTTSRGARPPGTVWSLTHLDRQKRLRFTPPAADPDAAAALPALSANARSFAFWATFCDLLLVLAMVACAG